MENYKTELNNFVIQKACKRPLITTKRNEETLLWRAFSSYEGFNLVSDFFPRKTQAEGHICKKILQLLSGRSQDTVVDEDKSGGDGGKDVVKVEGSHFIFIDVENVGEAVKSIYRINFEGDITFVCVSKQGNPLIGKDTSNVFWKVYQINGKNASDFAISYIIGAAIHNFSSGFSQVNFWLITKDSFGDTLKSIILVDKPKIKFSRINSLDELLGQITSKERKSVF